MPFLLIIGVGLLVIAVEEVRQRLVALARVRLGAFGIGAGIAQRFGQPARLGEETFGFGRHVALLQMCDEIGRASCRERV